MPSCAPGGRAGAAARQSPEPGRQRSAGSERPARCPRRGCGAHTGPAEEMKTLASGLRRSKLLFRKG